MCWGRTPDLVFGLRSDPIVELVLGSDPRSGVWVGPPPPFLRLGWGGTPSQPHQMGSDPILGIVLGVDPSTPVCFGVGTFDCLFVSYSSPVQNPKSRVKPLKIVLGEGPTSDHGVRVGVLPQRNAGRRGGDPTQSSTTGSQGHRAGHRTGSGCLTCCSVAQRTLFRGDPRRRQERRLGPPTSSGCQPAPA